MPQVHSVHRFTRVIGRSLDPTDTRVIFGCAHGSDYAGCSATEIRRANEPSPFEIERERRRRATAVRAQRGA